MKINVINLIAHGMTVQLLRVGNEKYSMGVIIRSFF